MKEFISMWKHKSMIMLFFISMLFYIAIHLPFEFDLIAVDLKSFQLASAIPVVLGLFFGPAGVLGVGIGSFFIAIYGGLSFITPFIMLGNMLMALLVYKLWDKLLIKTGFNTVLPKHEKKLIVYNLVLLVIISSMAKSLVIGWGYLLIDSEVFYTGAISLFINDVLGGLLLSIFAIFIFLKKARKWEMIWSDLMKPIHLQDDSIIGTMIILYSIFISFVLSIVFSYFGNDMVATYCGALALLGIFIGLLWKKKLV